MQYKLLITTLVLLFSSNLLADARITVSKGNASLCEVLPTEYKKGRHYNKSVKPRHISSDLWRSGKNGLGFFHLNKSESQSQTVQLAFVDKYSTFWYYTKKGSTAKGPYFYDFIVPENSGRKFVDIDLELPCSCFLQADKPQRCQNRFNRFQDKFGNWWQQTGNNTAKRIGNTVNENLDKAKDATQQWWNNSGREKAAEVGNTIGKNSHKAWDASKKGWGNIKAGWKDYKNP